LDFFLDPPPSLVILTKKVPVAKMIFLHILKWFSAWKLVQNFLFDWEKEGESLGDGGFDTWVTVEDFNLCSFLCLVEIKSRRELQMS
jgi:hypothetical protein